MCTNKSFDLEHVRWQPIIFFSFNIFLLGGCSSDFFNFYFKFSQIHHKLGTILQRIAFILPPIGGSDEGY